MSLTSSLKDPGSPMSRFLSEHLPQPENVLADYRLRVRRSTAHVVPAAPSGQRPDWRMLGHTIDHRLRISLGAPTGQPIREGVRRAVLDDDGWPSLEIISTVQAAGMVLLEELDRYEAAEGQPLALEPVAEERVIRLCHLASGFETIFRHVGYVATLWACANPERTWTTWRQPFPAMSSTTSAHRWHSPPAPAPSQICAACRQTDGSAGPSSTAAGTSAARTPTSSSTGP
ncbi:hypothetical protein [Streptomyces termitum]|uniref:hypothetical protein n=1 Tax=Streptomyces termitum TaxID=67368 RepID=UPI0033B5E3F9